MVKVLAASHDHNGVTTISKDTLVNDVSRVSAAAVAARIPTGGNLNDNNNNNNKMSREEHAATMQELSKERAGWRPLRRGWSSTGSPVAESTVPCPTPAVGPPLADNAHHGQLAVRHAAPGTRQQPPADQHGAHSRPPLPPPRRSYSVIDYKPLLATHRPPINIDITNLPTDLHYAIFDFLDPIDGTCLGLTNSRFYYIYRRVYGVVPLSSRREGRNDLEWAWRRGGPPVHSAPAPLLSSGLTTKGDSANAIGVSETQSSVTLNPQALENFRIKGQVYCRKCGILRCELHRHLKEWIASTGKNLEYCAVTCKYGPPAPEGAREFCHVKSPKTARRCGRHASKVGFGTHTPRLVPPSTLRSLCEPPTPPIKAEVMNMEDQNSLDGTRVSPSIEVHCGSSVVQASESQVSSTEYDVSFSQPISSFLSSVCKKKIESLAGCRLSWWPLTNPEEELNPGHVRVYYASSALGERYYDDITQDLGDALFPKFALMRSTAPKPLWAALGTQAIKLNTIGTVSDHVHQQNDSPKQQAPNQDARSRNNGGTYRAPQPGTKLEVRQRQPKEDDYKVLFLTCQTSRDEYVSRTAVVGVNDKVTMENLRASANKLPQRWWMRIEAIKFYRFRRFHYHPSQQCYQVASDIDQQRYPPEGHQEYRNYTYQPGSWREGVDIPCRNGEIWYYFRNPEFCGTGKKTVLRLPVRLGDTSESDLDCWGLHLESRPSIWVLISTATTVALLTNVLAGIFVPWWLQTHPDDLQNATIPLMIASQTVQFLISMSLALAVYRWGGSPG